ncbi:hypothetical protein BDN72DRAFT_891658 [Pluteus cervinus]|uniref:Uncharacterized protein n=1 Tax=Pluteus cervinus TaxID=181527 RepID=A0ACD3BCH9_9AGAR|nr:hypothetical protein BDN72DRAFT_891658 [Pluteus cervinus]
MSLIDLPIELQKRIGIELPDIASVHSLCGASRVLYQGLRDDELIYREQFLQLYDPPKEPPLSWKALYISRHHGLRSQNTEEFGPVALDMIRDAVGPSPPNLPHLLKRQDLVVREISNSKAFSEVQLLLAPLTELDELSDAELEFEEQEFGILNGSQWDGALTISANEVLWLTFIARRTVEFIKDQAEYFNPPFTWEQTVKPSLWKSPSRLEEVEVDEMPTKWLSCYLYGTTTVLSGDRSLATVDLTIEGNAFSGKGQDIQAFEMIHGKVSDPLNFGGIGGWRRVSWIKNYGGFSWDYHGVMFPGCRVIVGTWGRFSNTGGGFMLWAL